MLARRIAELGPNISPAIMQEMREGFGPRLLEAPAGMRIERDVAYGPHPRHRLNLFLPAPEDASKAGDIIVFVHGGGFVSGDKDEAPGRFYDNVGRWAARNGRACATMNYRLAPDNPWPAGRDDVALALGWIADNSAAHGGDAARIFVIGHSAGAAHVAAAMANPETAPRVAGCICVSGLYDLSIMPVSTAYFGDDAALYPARSPISDLARTDIPLMLVAAEYDPPFILKNWLSLQQELLSRGSRFPRVFQGRCHNHFSILFHMNTSDTAMSDDILEFMESS